MEDEQVNTRRRMSSRSDWRGLLEFVIGSTLITIIFLLGIFVALAN